MLPIRQIGCPYCGESIELIIDTSVERQSYIEDCPVCCRPIDVEVSIDEHAQIELRCSTDSET